MTTERLDSIDARLERLVIVGEQQAASFRVVRQLLERVAEASEAQRQSLQSLAGAVSELARSTTQLSQANSQLIALAERSAQAAEGAQILAQNNQVAIRDLIEEMRLGREGR
jgi:methyl-accepting chemotaxis protein